MIIQFKKCFNLKSHKQNEEMRIEITGVQREWGEWNNFVDVCCVTRGAHSDILTCKRLNLEKFCCILVQTVCL